MPVPIVYRKSAENVITSYDSFDFTTGAGYKKYYALQGHYSGAYTYVLTTDTAESHPTYSGANLSATSGWSQMFDIDFDLDFKNPLVIKGTAIVNFTWVLQDDVHGGVDVNVYHVSVAGTETLLGTKSTPYRAVADTVTEYHRECIVIPLTTKKFTNGEKLRLNVIAHGGYEHVGGGSVLVYFDPSGGQTFTDTDGRTSSSAFEFNVPFKIDL